MRFKIVLESEREFNVLPINYQYEMASWIYKVLDKGDARFAKWLHGHGFNSGEQYFKFFTFSQFVIPRNAGKILRDRILLNRGEIHFFISFLPEKATESFIKGLFKESICEIANDQFRAIFRVSRVEMEAEPDFKRSMQFTLQSPMVISKPVEFKGKLQHKYLDPEDAAFEKYFSQNLSRKYQARYDEIQKNSSYFTREKLLNLPVLNSAESEIKFKLLNKPRKKGISLKSTNKYSIKVIGYLFSFEITAPEEITKTGYYGGFGELSSMGFGCGEVM